MHPDTAVARVGMHTIYYREIACDRHLLRDTSDAACHQAEQQALSQMLRDEWSRIAAARYHLDVTDEQVRRAVPERFLNPNVLRPVLEKRRALAGAALAVLNGGNPDSVYKRDLSSVATREEFESARRMFTDRDQTARYLARLTDAYEEKLILDSFRTEMRNRRISEIISGLAREWGVGIDEANQRFWGEIARASNSSILVSQYLMFPEATEKK